MSQLAAIAERTCAYAGCTEVFTPRRRDKAYCSDLCRGLASRARSEAKRDTTARPRLRAVQPPLASLNGTRPAWDPPSAPRGASLTAEPCEACGGPLNASPRGTTRACVTCGARVVPAGVAAPYDRADQIRQVRSQREIDLAEIGLARRKGVMFGQLGELAANPRLDQSSVPVVEWFREQVHTARSDGRLDELAALLPEAGIKRRRWWQGQPAAITAAPGDG